MWKENWIIENYTHITCIYPNNTIIALAAVLILDVVAKITLNTYVAPVYVASTTLTSIHDKFLSSSTEVWFLHPLTSHVQLRVSIWCSAISTCVTSLLLCTQSRIKRNCVCLYNDDCVPTFGFFCELRPSPWATPSTGFSNHIVVIMLCRPMQHMDWNNIT